MTITREQLNNWYCEYQEISNNEISNLLTQNLVTWTKGKRSVLFLDEFNRSPADILNASLQLILDKRLNDHVLPVVNGQPTLVVAAINPDGGDYTVNSLDPALLDRFLFLEAEADHKEWLSYARAKGINSVVRDFITEHTDRLHFEPADGATGATPRSWEKLGAFIDINNEIEKEFMFPIIKGMVGSEVGSQFLQFFNNYSKVVKFVDVEKEAKKLLKKHKNDIEKVGEELNKSITGKQETIQQMELAANFYEKYIDKKQEQALPLLAFLYSMPLEQATAFITSTKKEDAQLVKFGELDQFTGKTLLKKILFAAKNAETSEGD